MLQGLAVLGLKDKRLPLPIDQPLHSYPLLDAVLHQVSCAMGIQIIDVGDLNIEPLHLPKVRLMLISRAVRSWL